MALVFGLGAPAKAASAPAAWNVCQSPGPMFFLAHRPRAGCLAISPQSATIVVSTNLQFTATIPVTWRASGGTISSAGVFSSSSVGKFTVTAASKANPQNKVSATVTVTPPSPTFLLSASPGTLAFGGVTVGLGATLPVVLTNNGNADVTVQSASFNAGVFSLVGTTLPLTIAAGTNQTVSVQFAPLKVTGYSATASFGSNATNSPAVVKLTGTGLSPQHEVDLSWAADTSPVVGYNIYRGTQSSGPFVKMNPSLDAGLTFNDMTVQAGATYFYQVTSVDSNNVESAPSNQVSVTIPTP